MMMYDRSGIDKNVFRDLELVEQLGSGMSRILKVYDEKAFDFRGNFLVVTFPFKDRFESSRTNDTVKDTVNDRVSDRVNDRVNDTVNSMSEKILAYLRSEDNQKISDIAEKLNVSYKTIQREIKKMKDSGLLERIGSDKTGHWKVSD